MPKPSSFYDHLKQALESFDDPEALGRSSPLAAPYVLGEAVRGAAATAAGRGQALRAAIERAVAQLWGEPMPDDGQALLRAALDESPPGGRYDALILELNYLRRRYRPAPRNQAEIYSDILHISRPTHDRHLRGAVDRLGAALLRQLRPVARLEQPVRPPALVGRDALLAQALGELRAGRAVSLTGPGGVGKTSLGATLAARWGGAVFWFTVRPAVNDQLGSLLFALGHFLHEQGASALWHQLAADGGRIGDGGLALGLALADLAALPRPPLLCFDELDLLRPAGQDQAPPAHLQLLEFLDGLRGHGPLLLIGQRAFWASDTIHAVDTFSPEQLGRWLESLAVPHTPADVTHLHTYTAGNPRLAELCVALYEAGAGASLAEVIRELPRSQALLPLWLRLERRLPPDERRVAQELAVFRSAAPADVWMGEGGEGQTREVLETSQISPTPLARLLARRLVQRDDRGGVALLPALRELIYAELPVELREELHGRASAVRAERGEYTAAAHHLFLAGRPGDAVAAWFPHRADEIGRGQAGAALAIFSQISQRRLAERQAKELLLLRSELHALAGTPARVVEELAQASWPIGDPATPEAMLRLGQATEAQGRPDQALAAYQSGLDATAHLLRRAGQLHVQRSLTYLRQREMAAAWREAQLARFQAETMLGAVHDQSGDYAAALGHYQGALAIAEAIGDEAGLAQTHHYLAILIGRRQELGRALHHFEQAIAFYDRVGDRVSREHVRGNLASAYIQARRFAEAIAPAEEALRFFEAMGNSVRVAQNASNLAEAHAELGNLDPAQHFANLVLRQEEPQSHPYALYTLGTVYRMRGELPQSARYYDESRGMAERHDDAYLLAFAHRALGEVRRAQGQAAQAQAHFAQALQLFQQLNIPDEIAQTRQVAEAHDANRPQDDAPAGA